jgi:hypothetical protein
MFVLDDILDSTYSKDLRMKIGVKVRNLFGEQWFYSLLRGGLARKYREGGFYFTRMYPENKRLDIMDIARRENASFEFRSTLT